MIQNSLASELVLVSLPGDLTCHIKLLMLHWAKQRGSVERAKRREVK